LLCPALVVPQFGVGGHLLELVDAAGELLDVEDLLDSGHGGIEGGDVGGNVGVHRIRVYAAASSPRVSLSVARLWSRPRPPVVPRGKRRRRGSVAARCTRAAQTHAEGVHFTTSPPTTD